MIYIRDDDILVSSSSWKNPFGRFKQIHEWTLQSEKVLHVPAILVTEIQQFPQAVEYIKEETKTGNMKPQLHGLKHVDPGKQKFKEIREDLKIAKEWMVGVLGVRPTIWYTPWGAGEARGQEYIWEAANLENLEMRSCKNVFKLNGRYGVAQLLREGHDPIKLLDGKDIIFHWWERGNRLNRVIKSIEKGSWVGDD